MEVNRNGSQRARAAGVAGVSRTFTNFYKTRMCQRNGGRPCAWGAACNFAHSTEELRPFYDLTKTKMCPAQVSSGSCKKVECRFAHCISELRSTEMFYKTQLCIDFCIDGECQNGVNCRHAHGKHELRSTLQPFYTPHYSVKLARAHRKIKRRQKVASDFLCCVPPLASCLSPQRTVRVSEQKKNETVKLQGYRPDQSTTDSLTEYLGHETLTLLPPPGFSISPRQHIENLAALITSPASTLVPSPVVSPLVSFQPQAVPNRQKASQPPEPLKANRPLEHQGHLEVTLWESALPHELRQTAKKVQGKREYCKAVLGLSENIQASLCRRRREREKQQQQQQQQQRPQLYQQQQQKL